MVRFIGAGTLLLARRVRQGVDGRPTRLDGSARHCGQFVLLPASTMGPFAIGLPPYRHGQPAPEFLLHACEAFADTGVVAPSRAGDHHCTPPSDPYAPSVAWSSSYNQKNSGCNYPHMAVVTLQTGSGMDARPLQHLFVIRVL